MRGSKMPPNAGKGRAKGVPNKVTTEFREAVTRLLEDNSENFGVWLDQVAKGDASTGMRADPGKALDLVAKLAEFAAPKLARTEVTGANGGPVAVTQLDATKLSDDQLRALSSIEIPE